MDNEISVIGGLIVTIGTSLAIIRLGVGVWSKITESFIQSLNTKDKQFLAELKEIREDRESDRAEREAYNTNHLTALSTLTSTMQNIAQTINKNSTYRNNQLTNMSKDNVESFREVLDKIEELKNIVNQILSLEKLQIEKIDTQNKEKLEDKKEDVNNEQ